MRQICALRCIDAKALLELSLASDGAGATRTAAAILVSVKKSQSGSASILDLAVMLNLNQKNMPQKRALGARIRQIMRHTEIESVASTRWPTSLICCLIGDRGRHLPAHAGTASD
jgi:hypothetical protein